MRARAAAAAGATNSSALRWVTTVGTEVCLLLKKRKRGTSEFPSRPVC